LSKLNPKETATFAASKQPLTAAQMEEAKEKIRKVLNAGNDTSKGQSREELMQVTEEDAAKILSATGINVAGYTHTIDKSGVNHSYNSHGQKRENLRGQRILANEDFLRIPEIIKEYDSVKRPLNQKGEYAKSSNGNELILYTKKFSDGSTYYVEEVRTGKKELAIATMWVIENGEPNSSPYAGNEKMLSINAPSALTSETLSHDKGTNTFETAKENLQKNLYGLSILRIIQFFHVYLQLRVKKLQCRLKLPMYRSITERRRR
jgi:hypothetical protein